MMDKPVPLPGVATSGERIWSTTFISCREDYEAFLERARSLAAENRRREALPTADGPLAFTIADPTTFTAPSVPESAVPRTEPDPPRVGGVVESGAPTTQQRPPVTPHKRRRIHVADQQAASKDAAKNAERTKRRAEASEDAARALGNWLKEVPPAARGDRLMQVLQHREARRLASELSLFRPRVLLGVAKRVSGERPRIRSGCRAEPPDAFRLHAFVEFKRCLARPESLLAAGKASRLIHAGTRVICGECGNVMRFEAADSEDDLRLTSSQSTAGSHRCTITSTRRLSVLNRAVGEALPRCLNDAVAAETLYRAYRDVVRLARARGKESAAFSESQNPAGPPKSPAANKRPRTDRPGRAEELLDHRAVPLASRRDRKNLIRTLRHIRKSAETPGLCRLRCKLAVRHFARQLERRKLRRPVSKAEFVALSSLKAAVFGSPMEGRAKFDRFVDSLRIDEVVLPGNEKACWVGEVAFNTTALLKLILPATWHVLIDTFGGGIVRAKVRFDEVRDDAFLAGPVRVAIGHGDSQREIAADFGISQSRVSGLARLAVCTPSKAEPTLSLVELAQIRLAQRRSVIRRSLQLTPAPWTKAGDQERLGRLKDAFRRLQRREDPFPERSARSLETQLNLGFDASVSSTVNVFAPFTAAKPTLEQRGVKENDALPSVYPLSAEDLVVASFLLRRRLDNCTPDAPGALWRELQSHHLNGGPRTWHRPVDAVRRAELTLSRFSRGELYANDPVLGALLLCELGGWIPPMIEAFGVAGYPPYLIAPRVGLPMMVVEVYQCLFGRSDQAVDGVPVGERNVAQELRALLIRVARTGKANLNLFLESLRRQGRLPAGIQLETYLVEYGPGDRLAHEIVFERTWMTPTAQNRSALDKLQDRLAAWAKKK